MGLFRKVMAMKEEATLGALSEYGLTSKDVQDIKEHGINLNNVLTILQRITTDAKYVDLQNAATLEDGIIVLSDEQVDKLAERFDDLEVKPGKFVPASGAASRMFKVLNNYAAGKELDEASQKKIDSFIAGLDLSVEGYKFAFLEELTEIMAKDGLDLQETLKSNPVEVAKYVLEDKGLGYAAKPKAVIAFHTRDGRAITPIEEHMMESLVWAGGKVHFTISPEHKPLFDEAIAKIKEANPALADVEVTMSFQHPSTDSIAIYSDNGDIARDKDGKVAFFPAGHGALIKNVNDLPGPAILRNIDNVPKSDISQELIKKYHQAMSVILADAKEIMVETLDHIQGYSSVTGEQFEYDIETQDMLHSIAKLMELGIKVHIDVDEFAKLDLENQKAMITNAFMRPIKIVGVVLNQGEPGGGPFVIEYDGKKIVSIVEKDEISADQKYMMKDGAYFNPVDVLADPTNPYGEKMDVMPFVNQTRYFKVEKGFKGERVQDVNRMEQPGLWNGAMDGWNTGVIVIPIETFEPVKEVFDLTKPGHQEK